MRECGESVAECTEYGPDVLDPLSVVRARFFEDLRRVRALEEDVIGVFPLR